jgi:hypothetical protein
MRLAWSTDQKDHEAPSGARKRWLQETYGIDNGTGTYVRLAAAHLRLGRRPAALMAIVEAALRLAVEYRSTDAHPEPSIPSHDAPEPSI